MVSQEGVAIAGSGCRWRSPSELRSSAQREARQSTTLADQQAIQERVVKLERQQRRQRQEIFDVEDEVQNQREQLIEQLTKRLTQQVATDNLFTVAWTVV